MPLHPNRRRFTAGLLASLGPAPIAAAARDQARVLVLWTSEVGAYAEALDGVRQGFGEQADRLLLSVDLKEPPPRIIPAPPPPIAVAIGIEARRALEAEEARFPVLSTMVYRADGGQYAVFLDPPLDSVIAELGALLPGRLRLGVIEPVGAKAVTPAAIAKAKELGHTLMAVEAGNPDAVAPAFLSFRNRADLVFLAPDRRLYSGSRMTNVLRLSLENRLPVIGFAPPVVRAGAALGIYSDYVDLGLQTAEVLKEALSAGSKQNLAASPRRLTVALNQRSLRLLGMKVASVRSNGEPCVQFQ